MWTEEPGLLPLALFSDSCGHMFTNHAAGEVVGSICLLAALPQHGFAVVSMASTQRNRKFVWFTVSDLVYLTSLVEEVRSQGFPFLTIRGTALSTVGCFDF